MMKPLTDTSQAIGLSPTRLGKHQSGSIWVIFSRSRTCLDLPWPVPALMPNQLYKSLALIWGSWDESNKKLAMPMAWLMPQAQVWALPLASGEGRFRHRAAVA